MNEIINTGGTVSNSSLTIYVNMHLQYQSMLHSESGCAPQKNVSDKRHRLVDLQVSASVSGMYVRYGGDKE